MTLEKEIKKTGVPVDIYEGIFSKIEKETITEETDSENQGNNDDSIILESKENEKVKNEVFKNLFDVMKKEIKKPLMNNFLIFFIAVVGIVGYAHQIDSQIGYNKMIESQNKSQKVVNGLLYNLSENNNLEQIANNIYLGMKENGWEPLVKISNREMFVFELEMGGEFIIKKNEDFMNTKFHVQISKFSEPMLKALLIQLEPDKIGGTKIFIRNKILDRSRNTISFDLDKIGSNSISIDNLPIPNLPPIQSPLIPQLKVEPQVMTSPVSPALENELNKINEKINKLNDKK